MDHLVWLGVGYLEVLVRREVHIAHIDTGPVHVLYLGLCSSGCDGCHSVSVLTRHTTTLTILHTAWNKFDWLLTTACLLGCSNLFEILGMCWWFALILWNMFTSTTLCHFLLCTPKEGPSDVEILLLLI